MSEWSNETAEWYASKYGEYPTNRLTIEHLDLASDAVVVDVGCGTASALRHAAQRVTTGRLIGVDPVPRMIEIARERLRSHPDGHRIQLFNAPAHALPLDDDLADVVLALDSYDHWKPHQYPGLLEVRRVLAPGGRFVVVKDGGVPGVDEASSSFLRALGDAGFVVTDEASTSSEDVRFVTWICRRT